MSGHLAWFLTLAGCVTPFSREVTISTVRLPCASRGIIVARDESDLRRRALARGARHVVLLGEAPRISRRFASPPRKPSPYFEVYFARDRWVEGEALQCARAPSTRCLTLECDPRYRQPGGE